MSYRLSVNYAAREKYDRPGKATAYRERSARRNAEEWALLSRALDRLTPQPSSAWDVPCGTGRIAAALWDRGIPTRAGDLSPAMRAETDQRLRDRPAFEGAIPLDLEAPDPHAAPADLVVCFRFLHHLPDAAHRARVWRALRSLTARDLLVSFHHPISMHNLNRRLRRLVGGTRSDRYTLRPRTLKQEAAAAGLQLVQMDALGRYRRELWLAHLRIAR